MSKIMAVRFKKTSKVVYINPEEYSLDFGSLVLMETENGQEIGRIVKILDSENLPKGVKTEKIIRPVTKEDLEKDKKNKELAEEALQFCIDSVKELELKMKPIHAEYSFDRTKMTIYFVSEERVDFRQLVKMLASEYKVRIELRQVGPRDEVKVYPNIGICGKEVCCRTFLEEFDPVTIKMAKEQGLQINMPKLSGSCGKLMCCLKYEQDIYRENLDKLPKVGSYVTYKGEKGKVQSVDILGLKVKVKFGENEEDYRFETYDVSEIKFDKKFLNKEEKEDDKEEKEGSETNGI